MDMSKNQTRYIDMSYEVLLNNDEKSFMLPLVQFCDDLSFLHNVSEIEFVLHKKKVPQKGSIIIKNLCIE